MTNAISNLDRKYVVLKWDDIEGAPEWVATELNNVTSEIHEQRGRAGKGPNNYVVLNMEDELELKYLIDKLEEVLWKNKEVRGAIKVKDIAVHLVNSILVGE